VRTASESEFFVLYTGGSSSLGLEWAMKVPAAGR